MNYELDLFNRLAKLFLEKEQEEPVSKYIRPENLANEVDYKLEEEALNQEAFEQVLSELVLKTPKTSSKLFFNQLFGGRKNLATLGDLLSVLMNNSMYTYKVAGVQVALEKEIIQKSCEIINYPKESDGTIPPGGSSANLMAMILARDFHNNDIRFTGVTKPLIVYTSINSHYSIPKNASFIGVGRDNVRYIPSNEQGQMIPAALENQIQQDVAAGYAPFFLNATAGTTVLGAYDPFEELAKICKANNIWFHIDGAYGGPVIFSDKYKHLLKGVELSDSFCYNAHKILSVPLTCSVFLTKHKEQLYKSIANDADYLYQGDSDEYNLGKTSIQCGRRNDALKFWTLWKAVGTKGLAAMVDKMFALADFARNYVSEHPDYQLHSFNNSLSICFTYKNVESQHLCTQLYENSETLVSYGIYAEKSYVRLVIVNSEFEYTDIENFFKVIERFVN